MKKLIAIAILFASCTKQYTYVAPPKIDRIEDTTFKIYMDRCPNTILTCFFVDYPNYKDTLRLEVSWMFGNNSFREILYVTKRNQILYTNCLFYGVVPFKY